MVQCLQVPHAECRKTGKGKSYFLLILGPTALLVVNTDALVLSNPFLTSRLLHPYHFDESISSFKVSWWLFSFLAYLNEVQEELLHYP